MLRKGRGWRAARREVRAGTLCNPLRAADRGVAEAQRRAPRAAVGSQLRPRLAVAMLNLLVQRWNTFSYVPVPLMQVRGAV